MCRQRYYKCHPHRNWHLFCNGNCYGDILCDKFRYRYCKHNSDNFKDANEIRFVNDAVTLSEGLVLFSPRITAEYPRFGPIEKILCFCDLSVRKKDWRGKPGL